MTIYKKMFVFVSKKRVYYELLRKIKERDNTINIQIVTLKNLE